MDVKLAQPFRLQILMIPWLLLGMCNNICTINVRNKSDPTIQKIITNSAANVSHIQNATETNEKSLNVFSYTRVKNNLKAEDDRPANCTYPNVKGCTISRGQATCMILDIDANVGHLPACVQDLSIILNLGRKKHFVSLEKLNFTHLTHLESLSLTPLNRIKGRTYLDLDNDKSHLFKRQLKLKCIQIYLELYPVDNNVCLLSMLEPLKYLEILEFTGATNIPLDSWEFQPKYGIKRLHLRLSQAIYMKRLLYNPSTNLTKLLCGVGKTLEMIDLSYNCIVVLHIYEPLARCTPYLRLVDLRENLIHHATYVDSSLHPIPIKFHHWVVIVANVEHFMLSYRNEVDYMDGTITSPHPMEYRSMMSSKEPKRDILSYMLGYVNYLSKESNISPNLLVQCAIDLIGNVEYYDVHTDQMIILACKLKECILANYTHSNYSECQKMQLIESNRTNTLQTILNDIFHTNCMFGVPLPVPPNIQTITFTNIWFLNDGMDEHGYPRPLQSNNSYKVCIYPANHVKHFDIAHIKSIGTQQNYKDIASHAVLYGFHELESLNISDIQLQSLNAYFFEDMPSLKHLNISHNSMSTDGQVSDFLFQKNAALKSIDLSYMNITSLPVTVFGHLQNLSSVVLSSNVLKGYIDLIFITLEHLDLSHNQLEGIHPSMRSVLENISKSQQVSIDLTGNPLSCGCDNIEFLEWMQQYNANDSALQFVSLDKYQCDDTVTKPLIVQLVISDLKDSCKPDVMKYAYGALGTLAVLLSVITPCIIYRKRWIIRHFMYVTKEKLFTRSEEGLDENYEHDLFISYSNVDADRTWVHFTLVPTLENTYGFKTCIHHRDFLGGWDVMENIENAIKNSRKVVAIMSPDFLRSNWCCKEIKMADTLDHDEGTNKIIFVMFRPLGDSPVPAHITHLLSNRTFIEVDVDDQASVKVFWKRLVKALYTKTRRRGVGEGYEMLLN